MFDIVIPYKQEFNGPSEVNGLELKLCLRSVEKNLIGFRDVYVIGDRPSYFDQGEKYFQNIIHFDCIDHGIGKDHCIYNKMLFAARIPEVSENFLMVHDDHFILRPMKFDDIKYWHRGLMKDHTGDNCGSKFISRMRDTAALMPNGKYFDGHQPIMLNKKMVIDLEDKWTGNYLFKTLYCNTYEIEGEYLDDCKVTGAMSKAIIGEKIKGRLFFSTNAICSPTVQVLEERFPKKSKFEI